MIIENTKKVRLNEISELYSASSLAKDLGVSKEMVYYWKNKGDLPAYEINKTRYVFRKCDVIKHLEGKGYAIAE
jgi:predicted site-specific integrase-resolvase